MEPDIRFYELVAQIIPLLLLALLVESRAFIEMIASTRLRLGLERALHMTGSVVAIMAALGVEILALLIASRIVEPAQSWRMICLFISVLLALYLGFGLLVALERETQKSRKTP